MRQIDCFAQLYCNLILLTLCIVLYVLDRRTFNLSIVCGD